MKWRACTKAWISKSISDSFRLREEAWAKRAGQKGPGKKGCAGKMADIKFAKQIVFINCSVPLVMLAWDGAHRNLGANPLEFVTHVTGTLTLVFLLISLLVTPARKILGMPWLIKLRRMCGLFAFFYGCLHLITYVWFDRFFDLKSTVKDIGDRPFIAVGIASLLLLLPLAITSTNKMVKRLGGKRWNRLHKLVYLAGIGGVIHYRLLVKADARLPIAFGVALGLMLGYRIVTSMLARLSRPEPAR